MSVIFLMFFSDKKFSVDPSFAFLAGPVFGSQTVLLVFWAESMPTRTPVSFRLIVK